MPRPLPDVVAQSIAKEMPRTHEMIWLRGTVMGTEPIERPPSIAGILAGGNEKQRITDTRVSIFDIDTGEGWDVRLTFSRDIANGDQVSLFAHEEIGADRLTMPRLLYNHNTDTYARTYPDIASVFGTLLTGIEYKYSLSCRLPGTMVNRVKDMKRKFHAWFLAESLPPKILLRNYALATIPALYVVSVLLRLLKALVNPIALLAFLPDILMGFTFLLASFFAVLLVILLKLRHLIFEPPRFRGYREYSISQLCGFSNLLDWLRYVYWDITPVYEDAAQGVAAWVRKNPDAEADFIARPVRGTGEKGKISEKGVPALSESKVEQIPPKEGKASFQAS